LRKQRWRKLLNQHHGVAEPLVLPQNLVGFVASRGRQYL
jgi:hypothetical protein